MCDHELGALMKSVATAWAYATLTLANSVGVSSQAGRHDFALLAFSTGQDDPGPQGPGLRRAPCSGATPVTSTQRVPPHRVPAEQNVDP